MNSGSASSNRFPLQGVQDPVSPLLTKLLPRPYPAQAVVVGGVVKRLARARSAAVVAECGTGKTLISLASLFVASAGKPFTALAVVPSHLTLKWLREGLTTIPRLRAFVIDGLRNASSTSANGIHEVKLRAGRIVREGFKTTLTDLRLRKKYSSPRARWDALSSQPALFVISKETAKLSLLLLAARLQHRTIRSLPRQCGKSRFGPADLQRRR